MPEFCLPSNPWPDGFLRELLTQGMMTNGKSKNRFIPGRGDGCGHVWKVESNIECSSATRTAGSEV